MNTVHVRPRLDRNYDVIQSKTPQFLGMRQDLADAIALGEWAAKRSAPATLAVYGMDGTTVEETRSYEGTAALPLARGLAAHP